MQNIESATSVSITPMFLNAIYIPFLPLLMWLSIPPEQLFILICLQAVDWLTGFTKAYILKDLQSFRAISGILTKGVIVLLVLALGLVAKGTDFDVDIYLSGFISALIIAEFLSLIGNVYSIKTRKEVEEVDAVALVIGGLRVYIERLFVINRKK